MNLLALAIQAADPEQPEAKPVLGDAVLESGWWDRRVTVLVLEGPRGEFCNAPGMTLADTTNFQNEVWCERVRSRAAKPSRKWCRAVLAFLLFRDWDTKMWLRRGVLLVPLPRRTRGPSGAACSSTT